MPTFHETYNSIFLPSNLNSPSLNISDINFNMYTNYVHEIPKQTLYFVLRLSEIKIGLQSIHSR